MSKWKAGQCVTIEGKRYRVMRLYTFHGSCIYCRFRFKEPNRYPCVECMDRVPSLIPKDCYFKEIKPKS